MDKKDFDFAACRRVRTRITPRMLTKDQAAGYCGVSTPVFARICPIVPIEMGQEPGLRRYDLKAVDAWLDGLSGFVEPSERPSMAEMMKASAGAEIKKSRRNSSDV